MSRLARRASFIAGALALIAGVAHADLKPDELLLIVNGNVPQSTVLAEKYAAARNVPNGRIVRLDVPASEEIPPDVYDTRVAAPVRDALAKPEFRGVRCLVTFFGVPLRVTGRPVSDADRAEVVNLRRLLDDLNKRAAGVAQGIDAAARRAGVTPADDKLDTIQAARRHIAEVGQQSEAAVRQLKDANERREVEWAFRDAQQNSVTTANESLAATFGPASTQPATTTQPQNIDRPRDPAARAVMRAAIASRGGLFPLYQIVENQLVWLDGQETDAAVDSELALARLPDFPRYRWQPNPLNFRVVAARPGETLMVSRIDAPTPEIAARIIDDAIATEAVGLDGKAVFDSRGMAPPVNGKQDGYNWFDQAVRDVATFVKTKTKLTTVTDDREALIPPREVPGTAIYCGWYSLRRYVPSCGLVRGSVAYHVASFEMLSLHAVGEKGWCANLLKDNAAVTLGPVSEPYLQSFPRPDEFFPLLLTGKPTLAEVYWATTPMVSWKQTLIGDPLYRPFAKRPQAKAEDFEPAMRTWLEKTTAPAPAGR